MNKKEYVKNAKKYVCNMKLKDIESLKNGYQYLEENNKLSPQIYQQLVLYSPSKESNLGEKLSKKIEKHIDELVDEIIKGLDVKNCYFFDSFSSKNANKTDISPTVKKQTKPFLLMYCPNSFTESLFVSIRNALAHGNIIFKDNYYYLYSVSNKMGGNSDLDKSITFLLKLNKINSIESYIKAFEKYN